MSTPHLKQRQKFETVLAGYQTSTEAIEILRATPLVLVVGPSSVGRDTIINRLIKTGAYYDIVTDTTRPPRVNNGIPEQHGVEYFFRTEEEMLENLQAGMLLGPAIIHNQQVSGMNINEFRQALQRKKIAITDLEPKGAINITAIKSDTISVFVLPPSFEEWLARFSKRGVPSAEELRRRLTTAVEEFESALTQDFFVFVINNDLDDAAKEIDGIAHGVHHQAEEQAARGLAASLKAKTTAYLAKLGAYNR